LKHHDQFTLPRLVITSPNANWIPWINITRAVIYARQDGRYHDQDWTCWPQILADDFVWRCVCPRKDSIPETDPRRAIYHVPTFSDFIPMQGSIVVKPALGKLSPKRIEAFITLQDTLGERVRQFETDHSRHQYILTFFNALRAVTSRLRFHEHTFRELILLAAEYCRLYLECTAYMDWYAVWYPRTTISTQTSPSAIDNSLIGAWTTELFTVQRLHHAGIPVWYMRSEREAQGIIVRNVIRQQVDCITPFQDLLDDDGVPARAPILYVGPHGPNSHTAMNLMGRVQLGEIDLTMLLPKDERYSLPPLPPSRPSQSGPLRTSQAGLSRTSQAGSSRTLQAGSSRTLQASRSGTARSALSGQRGSGPSEPITLRVTVTR
jgi:hypothetical protein